MQTSTKAVQLGLNWDQKTGAVTMPIYQTATFQHPGLGQSTGYDYSRSGNPTRQVLEEGIAAMDNGVKGFAYSSGMAAISNLLLLFAAGSHLVVTEDLYGGTYRVLEQVFKKYDLSVTYTDTSNIQAVAAALRPNTRAVIAESLTNPLLKEADIAGLANLCRERGILCIIDNTFLTPYLLRPLEMGADITVYSASKYLAGHNDTIAGLVVVKDENLAEKVYFLQNSTGAVLGPQDSWLVIRGIKTLGIRLDRQQENALRLANWLCKHPKVSKVYYPGFGAMISFEVSDSTLVEQILSKTRLISFAESLGGVESLITYPIQQTHADILPEVLARLGINDRLLRLSVGIEDQQDLINDLAQALSD